MITKEFILENKDKWEEYKKEINELDKDILRDLIIEEPDIVDFIDLHKLAGYSIPWILKHHPRLIDYFKPYLDKLAGHDIYWFLKYQPRLIKYIKPFLHRVGRYDLSWVLVHQPRLVKYFKPYLYKLDKLDEMEISGILEERPELSLLFKYVGTEYQDAAYYYTCPSEISKLDEEEKYELSKKMVELIRKEKR